jgi:hypothetical protein
MSRAKSIVAKAKSDIALRLIVFCESALVSVSIVTAEIDFGDGK